ncbi:DUF6979 family protein [Dickeya zeae]|uniref:DUF6979 family protein n=1 Tax=Dickeya zeae TaxID=204042 RepID=UPI0006ACFCBA|nr:hypothetical protein [Dickeya zeae]MCA6986189.1 hypothetical protein [Dickeya zeae]
MNIDVYGPTAVAVIRKYVNGQELRECWAREIALLTEYKSAREKPCPRTAFLGLCEDGYVKGIAPKKYLLRKGKNKDYAIAGAKIILNHFEKEYLPKELWVMIKETIPTRPDTYNKQMHVVLALKDEGLLQHPN